MTILIKVKRYETKVIKTYFDYGNKLENYNNINRKEIKYCNTDKKNKLSNYNYYNSSQHIQNYNYNYNLRDKYKEEAKNERLNDNNYKNIIHYKKEEKYNINISNKYGITKEIKQKNKISNYHSSRKNHNYYESKSVNSNKMKNKSQIKLNNNQIINSYNKRNYNNVLIESINIKNEIKRNLNEKFQIINNNILINSTNGINQNKNSISNIPINKTMSNNSNKVKEELNNLKRILKIKKRKSHSYSPNKKIKKSYFIYGKNNKIILDMKLITNNINHPLNYSQSTKFLSKVKKEKNEIIKMNKLKKNLTEKNIVKIPININKKKNLIVKNKSFDSIMPPNKLNNIYKKN